MTSRCSPGWQAVTLADVIVDLVGEVGDKLGSLCQIVAPHGLVMQCCWNAREPGQRTRVDGRELWEAPIEDGRHVTYGFEVASAGGCQHVAEWVLLPSRPPTRAGGLAGLARRVQR